MITIHCGWPANAVSAMAWVLLQSNPFTNPWQAACGYQLSPGSGDVTIQMSQFGSVATMFAPLTLTNAPLTNWPVVTLPAQGVSSGDPLTQGAQQIATILPPNLWSICVDSLTFSPVGSGNGALSVTVSYTPPTQLVAAGALPGTRI
jgi:hypothetical protein